jgi:hypothetical protein
MEQDLQLTGVSSLPEGKPTASGAGCAAWGGQLGTQTAKSSRGQRYSLNRRTATESGAQQAATSQDVFGK